MNFKYLHLWFQIEDPFLLDFIECESMLNPRRIRLQDVLTCLQDYIETHELEVPGTFIFCCAYFVTLAYCF